MQIDEANVRLECRFEESPAFSVRVHLVTPGPDVVAESRDHTIRAAVTRSWRSWRTRSAVAPRNACGAFAATFKSPRLMRLGQRAMKMQRLGHPQRRGLGE